MLRLLAFIFVLFSFNASSAYHKVLTDSSGQLVGQYCIGSSTSSCYSLFPDENSGATGAAYSVSVKGTNLWQISRRYAQYNYILIQVTKISTCDTSAACFPIAQSQCSLNGQEIDTYEYISPDVFNYSCRDVVPPAKECEDLITAQCADNFGLSSSSYTDDGAGGSICSGVCGDGSIPDDTPSPNCDITNNYCDTPDTPSDLDFGSGNSGTDGGSSSSSSTEKDPENDIDYEPDGSGSSASENGGMSSLQGDKLINEVVKSRNDNTDNLASTTDTTNQTIVEKSDDIQETISNSANGIIDAINNDTPFYDGNIVDAINGLGGSGDFDDAGIIDAVNGLGTGLTDLGDKIDGLGDELGGRYASDFAGANFSAYDTIFIDEGNLTALTNGLKSSIDVENGLFLNSIREKFNFSAGNTGGYQANNLDLGKWGSHDISLARFSEYFGGVGNVVYFLAALTALTIILGGFKP